MTRRMLGGLTVALGAVGLLLSALALVVTWWAWPRVSHRGTDSLELATGVLQLSHASLDRSATTLLASADALRVTRQASLDIAALLESARPVVASASILLEGQAPEGIRAVQEALPAAEATARVVDDTLVSLGPLAALFGITPYEPEVPLGQALGDLGAGLEGLPRSLELSGRALRQTSRPLVDSADSFHDLAGSLAEMEEQTRGLAPQIQAYADLTGRLADQTSSLRSDLGRWLDAVPWLLSFVFLWLGLSQLALIQMGLHLIQDVPSGG